MGFLLGKIDFLVFLPSNCIGGGPELNREVDSLRFKLENASVAELVDALDSKPSSYECGFDSRPGYLKGLGENLGLFLLLRYNIGTTLC